MNEQLENLKWLVENLPNINESMSFLITELEETQKAFDELDSDYINLIKENKRYCEAIEDIKNVWKVTDTYQEYMDTIHDIIKDLEGEE